MWSPCYQKDKILIEKVQHRFTRMIPGFSKLPYSERLKRLGLWSLEERRNRADLIEVFKIVILVKNWLLYFIYLCWFFYYVSIIYLPCIWWIKLCVLKACREFHLNPCLIFQPTSNSEAMSSSWLSTGQIWMWDDISSQNDLSTDGTVWVNIQ